ncbi:hypothetical protein H2203_007182 [Taxawa tesnikishii (nom. ined.)]|nr:hypothetical protein H2203_007182 [Dothideales sp. JES 119]
MVIGAVNGHIGAVFTRLSALHAKNAFAFAVVVGELFANAGEGSSDADDQLDQLLRRSIQIPLPTYFALGRQPLPDRVTEKLKENAGELCSNLYFLGRRTTVKTSEGIRIVALGGAHADITVDKSTITEFSPTHTSEDVKVLQGANTADILITSEWPAEIRTGSQAAYSGDEPVAQQGVADLCTHLKPRYHFSTSAGFFEREPFFHAREDNSTGYQVTRFISLAAHGNPSKAKWIYAFSLDISTALPASIPAGVTASPLSFTAKKRKTPGDDAPAYSRYSNGDGSYQRRQPNKRKRLPLPHPKSASFACQTRTSQPTSSPL